MRPTTALIDLALVLALSPALFGQEIEGGSSAAARLRAPADIRLLAPPAMKGLTSLQDADSVVALADTTTGHFGLAGATIGGVVGTLLVGTAFYGVSESPSGGAFLYGAFLGGLPGFVIGGFIGSAIKKSPRENADTEPVSPPDTIGAAQRDDRAAG